MPLTICVSPSLLVRADFDLDRLKSSFYLEPECSVPRKQRLAILGRMLLGMRTKVGP